MGILKKVGVSLSTQKSVKAKKSQINYSKINKLLLILLCLEASRAYYYLILEAYDKIF